MKTTEELIKEFLDNGGKIEKLPPVEIEEKNLVGSSKKVPELKTLSEAELLYGKKQVKRKSAKKPDLSDINMDLIPDHIKKLLESSNDSSKSKEE